MLKSSQNSPHTLLKPLSLDKVKETGATVISCAANPNDIRPVVDGIVAKIEKISADLRKDQLLVLAIGEEHSIPFHKIVQMAVADKLLSGNRRVACGMEKGHNLLGKLLKEGIKDYGDLTSAQKEKISLADHDGQRALMTCLAFRDPPYAPVTEHTLMNLCLMRGVSTCFTDVASVKSGEMVYFDCEDSETANLIECHARERIGSQIPVVDQAGIELRNIAMVNRAVAHSKKTQAEIYMHLLGGKDHLFGTQSDSDYSKSLSARFSEAGAIVLPVFFTHHSENNDIASIPTNIDEAMLKNCVFVTNSNDRYFSSFNLRESDFINKLLKNSEAQFPIFDAQTFGGLFDSAARSTLMKRVKEEAPNWLTEAGISLPAHR